MMIFFFKALFLISSIVLYEEQINLKMNFPHKKKMIGQTDAL